VTDIDRDLDKEKNYLFSSDRIEHPYMIVGTDKNLDKDTNTTSS
jgi:hypothetical protein